MIVLKPALPEDYELYLKLMRQEASDYIEESVDLLGLSWDQFGEMFRSVGSVRGIFKDNTCAGFVWTENRGEALHVHALVFEPEHQNRGLGTEVMKMLESECSDPCKYIEVGIHKSNERARRLTGRLGFETVRTPDNLGFAILRKRVR